MKEHNYNNDIIGNIVNDLQNVIVELLSCGVEILYFDNSV